MADINLQEVTHKLYEKLKPSGWGDVLKTFILSKDFEDILSTLMDEMNTGKRFTPPIKLLFRAFEECPYDKLKVVVVGQDPYPYLNVPDGIAFSCSFGEPQASLRYIFGSIEETVYSGQEYKRDPDLKRWSQQGVLMLNTALTTRVGLAGTHVKLWEPFIAFLLDMLKVEKQALVYAFLGNRAKEWIPHVDMAWNHVYSADHPASAAHRAAKSWNSNNIFNNINRHLKEGEKIVW